MRKDFARITNSALTGALLVSLVLALAPTSVGAAPGQPAQPAPQGQGNGSSQGQGSGQGQGSQGQGSQSQGSQGQGSGQGQGSQGQGSQGQGSQGQGSQGQGSQAQGSQGQGSGQQGSGQGQGSNPGQGSSQGGGSQSGGSQGGSSGSSSTSSSNSECPAGTTFLVKFQAQGNSGKYAPEGGDAKGVTVTAVSLTSISWSSSTPIAAVVVKAGTASPIHWYWPPVTSGTETAPNGQAISHITFCTAQPGTVIVEKQTVPDADATSSTFAGTPGGSVRDNGQLKAQGLAPKTYTSTETVPDGWTLTSIACDDGQSRQRSTVDVAKATVTFNLDPGETVKCVFTNTKVQTSSNSGSSSSPSGGSSGSTSTSTGGGSTSTSSGSSSSGGGSTTTSTSSGGTATTSTSGGSGSTSTSSGSSGGGGSTPVVAAAAPSAAPASAPAAPPAAATGAVLGAVAEAPATDPPAEDPPEDPVVGAVLGEAEPSAAPELALAPEVMGRLPRAGAPLPTQPIGVAGVLLTSLGLGLRLLGRREEESPE